MNLVTAATNPQEESQLYAFLERLSDQARLPSTSEFHIIPAPFKEALSSAPRADLNIFGLSMINGTLPLDFMREVSELAKTSCVFVIDSGKESALV